MYSMTRRVTLLALAAGLCVAAILTAGAGTSAAAVGASYPNAVFSDGFESGDLSNWTFRPGNGALTPSAAAAHTGTWGLDASNGVGQFSVLAKALPSPITNSSSRFFVRDTNPSGFNALGQARDASGGGHLWELYRDAVSQRLVLFAFTATGSQEIDTNQGTAPANQWLDVEVRYDANANGGAQVYINGATQAGWGVSGNFTRSSDFAILQLWNDGSSPVQFDDVRVNSAPAAPTAPGAPTGLTGTAGNASVTLNWTAPADNGGSAITGYRITPYVGTVAQTPILTGSTATSRTVSGLTNNTAYTFTVAAVNAVGTGPASAASASLTPRASATVAGAPTGLQGTAGDRSVALSWTAPASDGGGTITSYRVTPSVGGVAQTAISTGSAQTSFTVTGLTNGTAYSFTVAAVNTVGTGPASAAAGPYTPSFTGPSDLQFSDNFESGSLSLWTPPEGTGSVTVGTTAHAGTRGLTMTNTAGQYALIRRSISPTVWDTNTRFWIRVNSAAGAQTVAQARDATGGGRVWELTYDGGQQRFVFYPYRDSGSVEVTTAAGSAPLGTWMEVQVRHDATADGGARLYINGQTQPSWGVSGDFSRSSSYRTLQLWNDGANSVSFDDVSLMSAPTEPKAPTGLTGASGDAWVTLNWTAPQDDGGRAVTGYRITPYIGAVAQTPILTGATATEHQISGLANGTTYTFKVAAINSVGTGPESAATASLTPRAVASVATAPSNVAGTAGDRSVALSWTAPTDDGGRTVTNYQITPRVNGVARTPIDTNSGATSFIVMGLDNATAYSFTVAAENAAGLGSESAASATLTPSWTGPSDVVFADGFESGDTSAWTARPGTGFVSVTPQAAHSGGAGLDLTNTLGQYSILAKGLSAPVVDSASRFWVNVSATSGVETIAQGRDGSSSARMWELAYDATNRRFIFYPYRSTGSTEIDTAAGSAPTNTWMEVKVRYSASVAGTARLYINGQTQPSWGMNADFSRTTNLQTLQLWNDTTGSTRFDDVQVASDPTTRPGGVTAPNAPTAVTAGRGDASATLSWTAPADDGGRPVIGYRITPTTGGVAQTPIPTGSSATNFRVNGLSNGSVYTFKVAAINSVGVGADSNDSNAVTPRADSVPDAPTSVSATRGDASAGVDWTAPADDGGRAITGYRVTPYVGTTAQAPTVTSSTATHATVNTLTNGTAYTFRVAAINAVGTGADSADTNAVTPQAPRVPDAPMQLNGMRGDAQVSLDWKAPADDGGSAITSYRVTPYIGTTAQSPLDTGSAASKYTVTGLTNNTAYTFRVAAVNAIGTSANSAASDPFTPIPNPPNAIVTENQKAGTSSWQFTDNAKAENHQIEGYASATSVNRGNSIDLKVSLSSSAQYTMDVYRMGWYPQGTNPDGSSCAPSCGGRLMQHVGPLSGSRQPTCPVVTSSTSPNYGMIDCQWATSYTLNVPTSWTSGNYIVKLTRLDGSTHYENFMTFAVRNDSSTAPIVYGLDTTTWQAYNLWGGSGNNNVGISLYTRVDDTTGADLPGSRAYTVSYNRPYYVSGASDGAGQFMVWDYPLVRYMESQGYDMTYVTSTDLERDPSVFSGHKVFVNAGHDEYYSDNMRARMTGGIASGLNLALFSANNFYYRITWAADGTGAALRHIHSDKGAQTGLATVEWKNLATPHPENEISGVMLNGVANARPFLVADANSWIYAGTGLKTYTGNGSSGVNLSGANQNALPGVIGYEFDARASSSQGLAPFAGFEPPGVTTVAHSFVPASDNGVNSWSDATLYTHPSGATVFAAGTMQWSFGVDDGVPDGFCDCDHNVANDAARRVTKNILDRLGR
jgi:predicted phage tail protein